MKSMNLKKYTRYVFVVIAVGTFSACKKVIDLKLDEAVPVIVIDGGISDLNENQVVKVSKTYNFTEPNKFNGVSKANIVLKADAKVLAVFVETDPGIYKSPTKFKGKPGVRYDLSVTSEGKTYEASSIMPARVILDALTFKTFNFFGGNKSYIVANFSDPAGIANQYRYILKTKGVVEEDAVSEDRFNDGNKVENVIFYELDDLVKGDSVHVEFQCVDRNVYRYFYSIGQNSGQGGPPVSPANPPSNFSNGALGVFNAHTSSSRTAVIK
ncbi:protein of unknown function [Pedobacter steynii]|uniref:DUF4249 domain-containing protein n=1 Tax=Pedobacter steynii TaxID=430522 RepID=A0A1G9PV23_9SPHI|nr:DUF4249 domain-containing protein [Pedobacter steynii]SDM02087.1 protein of unknown function [Pedobacter steynii]